jgi:hypothetical protein
MKRLSFLFYWLQLKFIIHNLHFESVKMTKPMTAKLCDAIQAFAGFNSCNSTVITKSNNKLFFENDPRNVEIQKFITAPSQRKINRAVLSCY